MFTVISQEAEKLTSGEQKLQYVRTSQELEVEMYVCVFELRNYIIIVPPVQEAGKG